MILLIKLKYGIINVCNEENIMPFDLFLEYNFAPIIGLIFQILILSFSQNFTKRDRTAFYIAICLETFELVTYNLEYACSMMSHYIYARTFLSVCGYLVRPMLVYPFIMLIREYGPKENKFKYLDLIPFGILFIIECIALEPTNHLVFFFSDDNIFDRGPLGYSSQIVTIFYLVEGIVQIIRATKSARKVNTFLVVTIFLYCSLSMLIETIFNIRSLGVNACIYSVVLFMFTLQANHLSAATLQLKRLSEEDSLSGLANRYYGEKSIREKLDEGKSGYFFILDVDDFKSINDNYGHYIGDEAIIRIAKVLKKCTKENDIVMRLGGDEFAIYSYEDKNLDIDSYINNIFKEISNIKLPIKDEYTINISVGVAKIEDNKKTSFDRIYKIADDKLYNSKSYEGNYISY